MTPPPKHRGTDALLILNDWKQVYTFVGSPSAVVEAALAAARVAYQLIDMAHHKGAEHCII